MERFMRFLLTNSNMTGCAVALAVVLLYLSGVIHSYWAALAFTGYAVGYLAMYRPTPEHCPEGLSSQSTQQWLEEKVLPRVSGEAQRILKSILEVAKELMPRLKEMESQGMVQAENRARLKQLLNRYLPDALETYLKLPSLYASTAKVAGGKTAQQVLVDQLTTLEVHVKELRDGFYSQNVDALLANGAFLKEKFDKSFQVVR